MPVQTLVETSAALALGLGGTLATSLDSLAVAIAASCGRMSVPSIRAGFVAGLYFLLAFSWLLGLAAGHLPLRCLGYLGLIPIVIGLRALFDGVRHEPESIGFASTRGFDQSAAAVALMVIVNGTDTMAVVVPLVAESETYPRLMLTVGFVAASALLGWLCARACVRPPLAGPIERYSNPFVPVIMIAIGIYILLNTSTDRLS